MVMYLSGLTCTDENVCMKGAPFKTLAQLGLAFLCPDTNPRSTGIPDEDSSWDFGSGAGMYLDATVAPWNTHYNM